MSRQDDLRRLLVTHSRRLQKLKEAQALKGGNTEPETLIQIEDLEAQIETLGLELKSIAETAEPVFQANTIINGSLERIEISAVAAEPNFYRGLATGRYDGTLRQRADPLDLFPFELIKSPEQLLLRLLPQVGETNLPDSKIKYITRNTEELERLFLEQGRVLVKGRSKSGKTREVSELLARRWYMGFTVLFLRPYVQLNLDYDIPEQFPYRNFVVVVDDIDHYCTSDENSASGIPIFIERLNHLIGKLERRCSARDEIRLLVIVRREPQFFNLIGFNSHYPFWAKFAIFELDDLPPTVASVLVQQLASDTNIKLDPQFTQALAKRNGGTFLNLILAFRDWSQRQITKIGEQEVGQFEGDLATTWKRRYLTVIDQDPNARYIYAALDLMRQAQLVPHTQLVIDVAARLEKSPGQQAINVVQVNSRLLVWKLIIWLIRQKFIQPFRYNQFVRKTWESFIKTRLVSWIFNFVGLEAKPYSIGVPVLREKHLWASLRTLLAAELPQSGSILQPYDGQVDGTAQAWLNSDVAKMLLRKVFISSSSKSDEFFSDRLLSLAGALEGKNADQAKLALIQKAIQINPNLPRPWNHLGGLYSTIGQYENALAAYDKAIALLPDYVWPIRNRTIPLRNLDRLDEALATLDKSLELDPGYGWTHGQRGITLTLLKKYEEAIKAFDEAIRVDPPGRVWHHAQKGITLRVLECYDEALVAFEQALKVVKDENLDWVYYQKGYTLQLAKRYDEALAAYEEGIKIATEEETDSLYNQKGITLRLMGQYDEALTTFEQAIKLAKVENTDWIHYQKGRTFLLLERFDEALAATDKAIELDPKYSPYFDFKGQLLAILEQGDEAKTAFLQAIKLDPKKSSAYINMIDLLLLPARQDEIALEYVGQAASYNDQNLLVIARQAALTQKTGQHQIAQQMLQRAIDLNPDSLVAVYREFGEAYALVRLFDEAVLFFDKALAIDPNDRQSHCLYADTFLAMGMLNEALTEYEKFVQTADHSDCIWALIGVKIIVAKNIQPQHVERAESFLRERCQQRK